MAFQRGVSNLATNQESQVEDTFISEMLSEFGKFNQDFFIMKIMSKAIDCIGTDAQKFTMLIDMLELALQKADKLTEEYGTEIKTEFETAKLIEMPNDMEKQIVWNLKRASIKFAIIFGKLSAMQPVEIIGLVDPVGYLELEKKKKKEAEAKKAGKVPGEFEVAA